MTKHKAVRALKAFKLSEVGENSLQFSLGAIWRNRNFNYEIRLIGVYFRATPDSSEIEYEAWGKLGKSLSREHNPFKPSLTVKKDTLQSFMKRFSFTGQVYEK